MTCRCIIFCSSYHFDLSTTNSVAAPKYDPWGPVNINGCSTSTLKHVVLGTLTDHNKLQNPNKMEFVNLAGSWQDSIKSMLKIPLFNSLFSLSLLSRESFGSWISASKITYKTGRYVHCIFQAISFRWYALNMLAGGSGSLILNKLLLYLHNNYMRSLRWKRHRCQLPTGKLFLKVNQISGWVVCVNIRGSRI